MSALSGPSPSNQIDASFAISARNSRSVQPQVTESVGFWSVEVARIPQTIVTTIVDGSQPMPNAEPARDKRADAPFIVGNEMVEIARLGDHARRVTHRHHGLRRQRR